MDAFHEGGHAMDAAVLLLFVWGLSVQLQVVMHGGAIILCLWTWYAGGKSR